MFEGIFDHYPQLPFVSITALFIGVYLVYVVFKRIQKAYFTPLYKIPGPWHVHLTSQPLKWAILAGRRCHYVQALHEKYGPIVRIGPDEVAFADSASSKEIHGAGSRFLKLHVDIGPTPNIFSMTDPKQHNIRRRMYAKGLSQTSLRQEFEPAVREKIQLAMSKIKEEARNGGKANLVKWFMFMANDVICLFTIGDGHGLLDKGGEDSRVLTAEGLHMCIAVHQFSSTLFYFGLLLSPISTTLSNIFLIGKLLYGYGIRGVEAARKPHLSTAKPSSRTFFAMALEDSKADNAQVASARAELTDAEICVDAAGFQLAGSDTVAISLTFLVWCVLRDARLQRNLEAEIATAFPSPGEDAAITDSACENLHLLNAVINETLRLHGAAPTALRRNVPTGGAVLAGYSIPDGTVVTTQAWSLHRNPDIWPDPERFDPARWLTNDGKCRTPSTETFMAFGAGPRGCAGIYMARMELRIAAAMFFRECRGAKLCKSATPESMVAVDRFNTHPVGRKCEITL